MDRLLQDRVSLITGAARGLGLGMAEAFYREGSKVVLFDIDAKGLEEGAKKLDKTGNRVFACQADSTDEGQVKAAIQQIVARFGQIDVLINNAGILKGNPIEEMSVADFEIVLKVNVTGTFIMCKAVVPVMKKQGRGKIVNMASIAGRTGRPGAGLNYATSKAGIIGLTRTLAREVGPDGIYVNAIAPGPIMTDIIKGFSRDVLDRLNYGRAIAKDGMPEDVANAALFLASDMSGWITGAVLDVNGGILMR
ncbi:MAG: SDR family NAD(P)-dependent oxidoreductase [Pseudomonadota bacterium]